VGAGYVECGEYGEEEVGEFSGGSRAEGPDPRTGGGHQRGLREGRAINVNAGLPRAWPT